MFQSIFKLGLCHKSLFEKPKNSKSSLDSVSITLSPDVPMDRDRQNNRAIYIVQFVLAISFPIALLAMLKIGWFVPAFSDIATNLSEEIPEIHTVISCYLWFSFSSLVAVGVLHAGIALKMLRSTNVNEQVIPGLLKYTKIWKLVTIGFLSLDGILILWHLNFYFSIHLYILWIAHVDSALMIKWYTDKLVAKTSSTNYQSLST